MNEATFYPLEHIIEFEHIWIKIWYILLYNKENVKYTQDNILKHIFVQKM